MSSLVKPHGGGDLKPLLLEGDALAAEKQRAAALPKVNVSSREAGDIIIPRLGRIKVAGLSVKATEGRIASALESGQQIANANVIVDRLRRALGS